MSSSLWGLPPQLVEKGLFWEFFSRESKVPPLGSTQHGLWGGCNRVRLGQTQDPVFMFSPQNSLCLPSPAFSVVLDPRPGLGTPAASCGLGSSSLPCSGPGYGSEGL